MKIRVPALAPADAAWLVLAAAVTAYEVYAARRRDYELLSEAMDRYRAAHPIPTHALIAYMGLHLARGIPRKLDPLTVAAGLLRR